MKIAYTVCNRHELTHALCLGQSIRDHNPEYHFVLGWVDAGTLPQLPSWVTLVHLESLQLKAWDHMVTDYYDFELVIACRPYLAKYILEGNPTLEELLFLSPTTVILSDLTSVLAPKTTFQLTPHLLKPSIEGSRLDDKRILNIGMYHSGAWILHPTLEAETLLAWWCDRTADRSYFDLCNGMCMDQLWLNYLPIYFREVEIIRNAGWHYGLHSFHNAELVNNQEKFFIGNTPLLSVEFAGIVGYHPVWSDHSSLIHQHPEWRSLVKLYHQKLKAVSLPVNYTGLAYGKESNIPLYRRQRKSAVRLLNSWIKGIEQYDLTYN